jgi:DNA helicase-2/ATP-dependent DNA helicase PcrA
VSDPYLGSPKLTSSQQAVVDQPWNARVLVTAGPGAGKTHTLVRRLEALLQDEDAELEAGELLVLSFSRAAVRELRTRIDAHAESARFVRVQTFDSWASTLLRDLGMEAGLEGTDFDDRIRLATEAVRSGGLAEREASMPAHVLIDEVQDLVGARRELVQAILEQCEEVAGFTVVGDPAQSVYGFTVHDRARRLDEIGHFFGWLRERYPDDLVELHLGDNFRAEDPEAKLALPFGDEVRTLADDADAGVVYDQLRRTLDACADFGRFDDDFVLASLANADTTAVLCETHDQVLYYSGKLHAAGIAHRVQGSRTSRPAPSWLAALLEADTDAVDRNRYLDLVLRGGEIDEARADPAWRSLRRVAASTTGLDLLDLRRLRRVTAAGNLPDEITAQPPQTLTISTIRRAKGLEFDRVLIVAPESAAELRRRPEQADLPEAARLLYVAMTRPRYSLYRVDRPSLWAWKKSHTDRWYRTGTNPRAKAQRSGIEVIDRDVDHDAPGGAGELRADATAIQQLLRSKVHPGSRVELRLLHELALADDESPPYGIYLDDEPIGEMSASFRRGLFQVLTAWRGYKISRWPTTVTEVFIDSVETVIGTEAATMHAGLGSSGAWLAPRLIGMSHFDWKSEGDR